MKIGYIYAYLGPRGMRGSTVRDLRRLYPSPNIVRAIRSRRLRWACQVARKKEYRSALKILTGIRTGKRLLGRLLQKYVSIRGIGLIRLRIGIIGEPL